MQSDLFGPQSTTTRPRRSKAWKWRPVGEVTFEAIDPRAPADVYRLALMRTTQTPQGLVVFWWTLSGPDLSLQATDAALLRRRAREHSNRRAGGRKAAATRAAVALQE